VAQGGHQEGDDMPANRTRRWRGKNRTDPTVLTEDRLLFFIYGFDLDGSNAWFDTDEDMLKCYRANREEIIEACIASRPCSRPDAFWLEHGKPRPRHPEHDFFDREVEAETLRSMAELTPGEFIHLQDIRSFYARCREHDSERWE